MNIAVNTRLLLKDRLDGIGRFTYETFRLMSRAHPEHQFYFLFDRPYDPAFVFGPNVTPVVIPPQARHPLLYILWFDILIPIVLKRINAELFVSPDGFVSRHTRVPTLAVFHDLNFEHYPNDVPFHDRLFYRSCFPSYARSARRIATVSEFSRQDIQSLYGVDASRIDVVYNGISDHFQPVEAAEAKAFRERLTDGKPYFIFVGAQHPRKNLVNLFKAFDLAKDAGLSSSLVIAGPRQWWSPAIKAAYEALHHKTDVIFTGRLDNHSLNLALGSATALTYVSYFEGFGIPILEAFRCEVPVITSRVTAMPEVAGDAAYLVDPFNPAEIAQAMLTLERDKNKQKYYIRKGISRLGLFSWERTASLLWESMMRTLV